ncbi:hypothetical protein R1CP_35745 (plasmid) [Rhodococcus opacus]|uniref:Uncharacterized protein n=1 Tax=Rhodococcus opacus TaxID=37919 RepID=A0A1B1KGK8_RHOOP|nr:hypothetical protein R1CP_35745 [Rhodococcus opacus]
MLSTNIFRKRLKTGRNRHPRAADTPAPGTPPEQVAGAPTSQTGDMSSHQVTAPLQAPHGTRPAHRKSGAGRHGDRRTRLLGPARADRHGPPHRPRRAASRAAGEAPASISSRCSVQSSQSQPAPASMQLSATSTGSPPTNTHTLVGPSGSRTTTASTVTPAPPSSPCNRATPPTDATDHPPTAGRPGPSDPGSRCTRPCPRTCTHCCGPGEHHSPTDARSPLGTRNRRPIRFPSASATLHPTSCGNLHKWLIRLRR